MPNDRRTFLKNVGGAAAAVVAGSAVAREVAAQAQSLDAGTPGLAADALQRPPGRVRIGLFLDGDEGNRSFAGWLNSVEGGAPVGDVVVEKVGPDHIQKKHIAGVKYEDITVNCGTGMSKAFYEWIKASFDFTPGAKNGAIVFADQNNAILLANEFKSALISEIGFPALDAASKDAAKMTIKFSPEWTRFTPVHGQTFSFPKPTQKRWLASNFKLTIDGLENVTPSVSKIDAITVKQEFASNPTGTVDNLKPVPSTLDTSNLAPSLPESQSDGFFQWNADLLANNNTDNTDVAEKGGTLEFLPADLQEAFFTLTFANLGAFKVAPDDSGGGENIRRVKCEMYCEEIKFKFGSSAWA